MILEGHLKGRCKCDSPHEPHSVGQYGTVCYGVLDYICPGVPGEGWEHVETYKGNAHSPSHIKWRRLNPPAPQSPRRRG